MRILTLLPFLLIPLLGCSQPSTVTVGNTTLDVRVVIQGNNQQNGIDIPWEIQWGPDDHIWMTERFGRVSRLNPETGERFTILDLSGSVYAQSEAGLLGLQLHPDFESTPHVFLAYTYSSNGVKERIVRYTYNGTTGQLESPLVLIDGINGNSTHVGCRLLILPDNTMLATTGDYQNQSSPQNLNSLNGKVLRMNLDGSIPADNPYGSNSYVYAMGLRNSQGLVLAPNGNLYSSEHGPTSNDELNIIQAGKNYGWPDVEGYCNQGWEMTFCNNEPDYMDPITIWYENYTIAPADLIWYDHPAIPEWQGKLLMTVLKFKQLKAIEVDGTDGTSVVDETTYFEETFQRLRDILVAPDGRVFLATSGSSWANTAPFTHSIVELKNSAYSPTGLDEKTEEPIRLSPNPTNAMLNVEIPSHYRGGDLRIMDLSGREAHSEQIRTDQMRLDLGHLAAGTYLLQTLALDGSASIEKIVLQK